MFNLMTYDYTVSDIEDSSKTALADSSSETALDDCESKTVLGSSDRKTSAGTDSSRKQRTVRRSVPGNPPTPKKAKPREPA